MKIMKFLNERQMPTEAERERLQFLIEECAEVIQEASKIIRWGYNSHHPFDHSKKPNRDRLRDEITDVMGCIMLHQACSDIDAPLETEVADAMMKKVDSSKFNMGPLK